MAWKFNIFTGKPDYYEEGSIPDPATTVEIIHVANFSALPDPTTVGLYDIYIVDNAQGNKFWFGSIGGTYYPAGAYYSDLTKWIYSESASKATQAEVNAGTDTEKYVTPGTLSSYDRWSTLLKKSTNIVTVDKTAGVGDFTSITAALASITTASPANPFMILVNPGFYTESNVTMKAGIALVAESLGSVVIMPTSTNDTILVGADSASIVNIILSGASAGRGCIHTGTTGAGFLIKDCNFNGNAIALENYGNPATSVVYVDRTSFTGNMTTGVYTHNIGSMNTQTVLTNCTYKDLALPVVTDFLVSDGANVLVTVTNTTFRIPTSTGTTFSKVYNGAEFRIIGSTVRGFETGIYTQSSGTAPKVICDGVAFSDGTVNLKIENTGTTGYFNGVSEYLKNSITSSSSFFIYNTDQRIITVAKKGGDFSSISSAIDSITDSSSTNKYLIQVGPGVYTEPMINLAAHPYVSLEGSNIMTTVITPDTSSHDIILIGESNEISFITLQNAGTGFAGLSVNDTGVYSQAHKVSFDNCNIGVLVQSATQDTLFYGEYIDFNGTYDYGVKVVSTNGFSAFANLENYYNLPSAGLIAGTWLSGTLAEAQIISSGHTANGTGTAFYLENGASLGVSSTYSDGFNVGTHIANIGAASKALLSSLDIISSTTWDLLIEHPTAIGTFSGSASHEKTSNASTNFAWAFLDSADSQFEITGKLALTYPTGEHSDISSLLLEGGTMGVIEGGALTAGAGFTINVAAGYGYYEPALGIDVVLRKDWSATSITLSANQDRYIYFDSTGTLASGGSQPDSVLNIILGRVVTNATGIELIDETPVHAEHTSNRYGRLFREAMGSIYASGSIVSENATAFHLNVTGGKYFYASSEFLPAGGTNITFTPTLNGVPQTTTNTVVKSWDNAGTLTALTTGQYAKHSLYIVGDNGHEKYYLVYGKTTFASLGAAETGASPLAPTFIKDAITLIAGIIVTEGASNITEIIDQRPVIGFKAGAATATSDHLALSNLTSGDAGHTQFLMLDGSKPMAGAINMNTHAISNITTLNTIDPADWFKRGGNAYGADTIFGLTDAFALFLRTNNLPRIGIASSGEVSINNLTGATTEVIGATTTGQLTRSVSTTNLTEGTNLYFTDARAIASPLTGYTSTPGTITAADSLLSAIEKLNGNVSAIPTSTSTISHAVKYGEAITKGQAVYVTSANGTNMIVSKASNTSEATSSKTMGLAIPTGVLNDQGTVITEGLLDGLNTDSGNEGDPVWLGVNGDLIFGLANKPVAPAHLVFIGIITRKSATNGEIFVKVQNGFELNEIHDVKINSLTLANNDILQYNSTTSLWENVQPSAASSSFIPALPPSNYPSGYHANNGGATMTVMGNISAATVSGTAAAVSISTGSTINRTIRLQIPTVSTAGSKAGIRSASIRHSVGQGFFFSVGWCIRDAAYVAGAKQFHGFLPITTLGTLSNTVDNSSLINLIGVGSDAADTNLQVFYNDGVGTASKIDLGINFPANRTAGATLEAFYIFDMYNEPGTSTVKYKITNRTTGATAQGTLTTDLPGIDTLLGIQCLRTNGVTALATVNQWSHLVAYEF